MARISVGNFSEDITNFDPSSDQLDFGNISVHSLILGQEPDGTATIVYPWQPNQFQRILGVDGRDCNGVTLMRVILRLLVMSISGDIVDVFSWRRG